MASFLPTPEAYNTITLVSKKILEILGAKSQLGQIYTFYVKKTGDESLKICVGFFNLKKLDVSSNNHITRAGFMHIQHLSILSLDLSGCRCIQDHDLEPLQQMPLKYLQLSMCSFITNKGIEHLQQMSLEFLDLSNCYQITDAGLFYLKLMLTTS